MNIVYYPVTAARSWLSQSYYHLLFQICRWSTLSIPWDRHLLRPRDDQELTADLPASPGNSIDQSVISSDQWYTAHPAARNYLPGLKANRRQAVERFLLCLDLQNVRHLRWQWFVCHKVVSPTISSLGAKIGDGKKKIQTNGTFQIQSPITWAIRRRPCRHLPSTVYQ